MPKKTITDYTFYKLHSDTCDDIYIGCTSNFNNRKYEHKSSVNNANQKNYNTPKAKFIRENGGWDNWKMSPLEIKKDLTKREAECYETELIEKYKPSLNSMIKSFITHEQKLNYNKEYNKTRRPKRDPEKTKEYREKNKEYIKEWKAKYHEENKELIHQKKKEYYEKNKEKIKAKRMEAYYAKKLIN
jgi:hypothetical protein